MAVAKMPPRLLQRIVVCNLPLMLLLVVLFPELIGGAEEQRCGLRERSGRKRKLGQVRPGLLIRIPDAVQMGS